jgi:DNA-binding NtrC family response regulator
MSHALIVDDDVDSAETMALLIAEQGFTTATAGSLREARREIALRAPDVILLDLVLPDGSGLELAQEMAATPDTEIVLVTGHASLETSIEALRLGAADYLVKPVNVPQLQGVLSRFMRPAALQQEIADLRTELERSGHFGRLWGRAKSMQRVYDRIARVATTAVPVLVWGESGTGKELVANAIHELSRRRKQPLLAVNCGAISPQLIESELFGHEKGSFTGASRQHVGFFERANGGTLFLDEVTEMPHDMQVKLLRVLETGSFVRVGGNTVQQVDVRMVAATNRVPSDAVASGKLREDLFYRLNVFDIHLPPLRERLEDVPLLADHFLAEINRAEGAGKRLSAAAVDRLKTHHWPGNVRELRNAVQRAFVMAEGQTIEAEWLPDSAGAAQDDRNFISIRVGTPLAEIEKRAILATLAACGGHKERTAEALGISPKTLYNRLKEYGSGGGEES